MNATMTTAEIQALNDQHVINTYGTRKIAIVRGDGTKLWDAEGIEYLDLFAGIAVTNLGHAHPHVTKAIQEQAQTLLHVSNLYYIEPQARLAAMLSENCFADRWFFCNSGAEANEAAIKIARRYWAEKGTPKPAIISMHQSFHGRTMATITATGQPKYHQGFEPMLPGFLYADFDDMNSLEKTMAPDVGAILIEPIQGEGGVRIPSQKYLSQVRAFCDEHDILMILDEVQTGLGRTGSLFCHTQYGFTPDIMTLAKGLGNGVPIGAMGCTEEVASGFALGSHACTFGGNPLSSAAAVATLEILTEPGFIEQAAEVGTYFVNKLRELSTQFTVIIELRAKGLMIGVEMSKPVGPLIDSLFDAGIICGPAGPNVLRFLPALVLTRGEVDHAMSALYKALEKF